MGQKVNPVGLRLGINRTWDSRWYASKANYGKLLHEDLAIREYLKERLIQAGVSRIITFSDASAAASCAPNMTLFTSYRRTITVR